MTAANDFGGRHRRGCGLGAATVLAAAFWLSASGPAHAYLDPGTGTMILQGIIAAIGGAIAYAYLFAARLRQTFGRLLGRKDATDEPVKRDPDAER